MTNQTMSQLARRIRVTAAAFLMLLLGVLYPGALSSVPAQTPAKAQTAASGPPKEGIKVHGHWTIDIRNPDGKLVTHREFENALTGLGAVLLGRMLRRSERPSEWKIDLGANNSQNSPCLLNATPATCQIYEPASQDTLASNPNSFKTLVMSTYSGGNEATILAGTATAARDGSIDSVLTALQNCFTNSSSCNGFYNFTLKELDTPINVVAGQIIQVSVRISFS